MHEVWIGDELVAKGEKIANLLKKLNSEISSLKKENEKLRKRLELADDVINDYPHSMMDWDQLIISENRLEKYKNYQDGKTED